MVLYFSGTGNSRYAARKIAEITGGELVSINKMIKNDETGAFKSEQPYIFAAPTYAWRIPRIVNKFILRSSFEGSKKAYFIMTCGSETGGASNHLKKLCKAKGFEFMGLASIVMPENYVAMFGAPDSEEAKNIIAKSEPALLETASLITKGLPLPPEKTNVIGRFMTSVANPVFYKFFVSSKGFYSTEACTGCGLCTRLCPLNNIKINSSRPLWNKNCTHCMACICGCPSEAIEYKNHTQGKPRYFLKDN